MSFKLKHMIFGKIAITLCLCLVLNNTYTFKSYADGVSYNNPLFIPFTTLVTSALIGAGIIGKNAVDASNKLVQAVSKRVQEKAIQSALDGNESPFRVIVNNEPEQPNNNNKNGKWFAIGAAAAGSSIACEKSAVDMILESANELKAFNPFDGEVGVLEVSQTNLKSTANESGIALQLANIDSRLVTQFDHAIHCDNFNSWLETYNINRNDVIYSAIFDYRNLSLKNTDKVPVLNITAVDFSNIKYIKVSDTLSYKNFSWSESSSYYGGSANGYSLTNFSASGSYPYYAKLFDIYDSDLNKPAKHTIGIYAKDTGIAERNGDGASKTLNYFRASTPSAVLSDYRGYVGYKWQTPKPYQFTNNVYNINYTIAEQFPNWLQPTLEILGQQLQGIQIGIDSIQPSWQPTQEQVQSGEAPTTIINQYINYYENPTDIPEDVEPEPNPGPETDQDPEPSPPISEPLPTDDYLGNFLLPESITTKFPFCIPFDVARCLRLFSVSQREAPKWECDLNYGSSTYHIVIDLAMFNDVANFIRPLEYILFLVGLAMGTRSLIRG